MKTFFKKLISFLISVSMVALIFVPSVPIKAESNAYTHLFPIKNGRIGHSYGEDRNGSIHAGIDIWVSDSNYDDTVYAACSGTVEVISDECGHWSYYTAPYCEHYKQFGNYIRIKNNDDTYSYYGHLAQRSILVNVGDSVTQGQALAIMGSAGASSGKHLHYEVRKTTSNTTTIHTGLKENENGGDITYIRSGYKTGASANCCDLPENTYYLKNKSSGLYLTVDDETNYVSNISVAGYNGSKTQKFNISGSNKLYTISTTYKIDSKTLNINPFYNKNTDFVSGANITLLYETKESAHFDQHWHLIASCGGYIIQNNENASLVLAQNGTNVIVETKAGTDNQIWAFEPATGGNSYNGFAYSTIITGEYKIKNKANNAYMFAKGTTQNTDICVGNGSTSSQLFSLSGTNKTYSVSPSFDKTLNINPYYTSRISTGNKINLWKAASEESNDQHWGFEAVSGGYIIHNMRDQTLVLGISINGTVQLEANTGAADQIWILESTHTHSFGAWTKLNDTQHQRTCACGEVEKANHTWDSGKVTKAATYTTTGVKTYTCTVCGATKNETIPVIPVSNAPMIVIDSVTAAPGSDVKVAISLKNNPGIASIKLRIDYGSGLTLRSIEYGDMLGGTSQQPQYLTSPVILNWFNGTENTNGDIVFAYLTFAVSGSATPGSSLAINAWYDTDDVYDISEKNIDFIVTNGSVTVRSYIPGDINDDGKVNNKDVTRLFQYLSGWDVEVNISACDCNGDGKINNKDVTRLFQYLSGWDVELK